MEKEKVITLIDAFKDFKEEKNIDRPVMMQVLKDVFLTQIAKTYGSSDNFDVIVNVDKGTCEIYQNFEIVEEVENPNAEMTLEQVCQDSGDDEDKALAPLVMCSAPFFQHEPDAVQEKPSKSVIPPQSAGVGSSSLLLPFAVRSCSYPSMVLQSNSPEAVNSSTAPAMGCPSESSTCAMSVFCCWSTDAVYSVYTLLVATERVVGVPSLSIIFTVA